MSAIPQFTLAPNGQKPLVPVEPHWFNPDFDGTSDGTLILDPYTTAYNDEVAPWTLSLTATDVDGSGHDVGSPKPIRTCWAAGRRIETITLGPLRLAFKIPRCGADIRLVSHTFIPAQTLASSTDLRSLGLRIRRLQIDDDNATLDRDARLGQGWNDLERHPGRGPQQWTTGTTPLPADARHIAGESGEKLCGDEACEIVVIPCCRLAFEAQGHFAFYSSSQVESHVFNGRKIGRCIVGADPALVIPKDHVHHPM